VLLVENTNNGIKIIVAYRNQHGAYKSVDDLLKIYVIKKDWLEKTKPYLKVGE
jgi:DNA uptake protein ComE-like DNA-binding protein